jgi:pyruvate dehydrogenase E2 component (dihydrolipoamide acetyltransferase)
VPRRRTRRNGRVGTGASPRPRSSPLARRLAVELGVDLAGVEGSGPGGSVVEADVRRAAVVPGAAPQAITTSPPVHAPEGADDKQAAMRRAIGALMARSKREIPHYYLSSTIDAAAATSWLEQANLERPVTSRLVLPALLLKATALAVARVPEVNGFFVDDEFRPSTEVHVGVAISLRSGGVIAPAIHDTDKLSLDEVMAALRDLVGRARSGVLRSSEMSDPTITVTNLGELGVESVFGVIYPPQVALVGFGQLGERVVARDGMLGVRPCLTSTLSADHRASDGHRGGRFLTEIGRLLQEPENL